MVGTHGLRFAKSVFFPDSRHDFKKKKVLQQSSKISKKNSGATFSFLMFFGPKKGSIYKRNCKIAKNSRNYPLKYVFVCKNIRSFRF
jgi:hypothetical protein